MLVLIVSIVVIIVVVVLIAALFVKKEYTVERVITIKSSPQEVYNYIKYLKNQEHYSKWVMIDPNVRRTYTGIDGTVGFMAAWDSENKNVGKGEQSITSLQEGKRMQMEVRFEKPFKNTANVYMTTEPVSAGQTKVTWGMKGKNPYPVNLMNLFIPGMLGKDLSVSLATLKGVLEK